MLTNTVLEQIKTKLIETYNPVEIYLWGSYAWGCPDKDSDVDLLVVVDECDPQERYKEMSRGLMALLDVEEIAPEIIVLNKDEFTVASVDPTRIFYKIKQDGKMIYARA